MVVNNTPDLLEAKKKLESFMSVNDTDRVDWTQLQILNNPSATPSAGQKARVVLISRPNSHPFQTRTLLLDNGQEVKVGRSLARNRASDNNAIFDCKVLSRNHAVIHYYDGKFFIKDTGSSNGTFINNHRLSQGSSQSDKFEVCSNDIVQFGVDVTENGRNETHGCIIATLKLFLPDGSEAKSNNACPNNIPAEDLCRLNQYIQEAVQREQILETKLINLQKIIEITRKNSSTNWQAMIDEDRLLSRIDLLENKLQCFQKNNSEDKLREEILKLQEDKSDYQNSAKEALRRVYQERSEALQKLSGMERALCSSEDECSFLRNQLCKTQKCLQDQTARISHMEKKHEYDKEEWNKDNKAEAIMLYAQVAKCLLEITELKEKVETLLKEKEELSSRVALYQYCENLTNAEDEDDDPETLSLVTNLLSNAELNHKETDDESSKITNNIPEIDNIILKDNLIEDRLNTLKKKLSILQKLGKDKNSEAQISRVNNWLGTPEPDNAEVISDGNQNVNNHDVDDINGLSKEIMTLSWVIYMELKARSNLAKQKAENGLATDVIEQYTIRIKELEKMLGLKSSQTLMENDGDDEEKIDSDGESIGTIIHQNDNVKSKNDEETNNEIVLLNLEIAELRSELTKLELSKQSLEKQLHGARNVIDTSDVNYQNDAQSQVDDPAANSEPHFVNKSTSSSFTQLSPPPNNNSMKIIATGKTTTTTTPITTTTKTPPTTNTISTNTTSSPVQMNDDDELVLLSDPKVQNEEELIIFKEKYNDISDENLKLKQDIVLLKNNYNQLKNKKMVQLLMYLSPLIVLIAYLLFYYL